MKLRNKLSYTLASLPSFLVALPVLAVDVGLNYGTSLGLGTRDVRETILRIIQAFFAFLGVLAILAIIYGGFRIMTAGGDQDQSGEGRKAMVAGVIGLVIVLTAFAIATFVVDSIINAL
ncbi:MAG: hypothetical protein COT81_01610 [Candidatus Buchananbacteria bacterium CG10_big_fil_rev_8_21_14_0_10_42_9]|uniref:Uncharacterized protein n=1 Tax=Candidatus Buchananbacteria bacterium CG10_big_fil_rev_8_21_14_0_10_42_9 TaxID=1974526 RepID=A0A2H0W1U2_9BACT|nr:MAG: hypothetical protein COT81_01610 [Candidatus Buchananbacteria bacterium CG10_big_fil_rev_8_21_14_0_10_42_9]